MKRAILKSGDHLFPTFLIVSRYEFVTSQAGSWPVRKGCRVVEANTSGYYHWQRVEVRPAPSWQPAAQHAFTCHAGCYSPRRWRAELRAKSHQVGRYALRSWRRASGQQAFSTRPQRPRTTQADPPVVVAENLRLGRPAPRTLTRPRQAIVPTCR